VVEKSDVQPVNVFDKVIGLLNKVGLFSRWMNSIGSVVIFAMVGLTFVDVVMRYVFSKPILAAFEITEVLLIIAVFLTIAHTQNEKGHITVDLISANMQKKSKLVLDFITNLLGTGMFAVIIWRTFVQTLDFYAQGSTHSSNLLWPSWPFSAVIVFGCTLMGLLLLRDLLKDISEALKSNLKWYQWLLMLGIPATLIVLSVLLIQPDLWQPNLSVVGFIGLLVFLVLLMAGIPIAFTLLITGFLFIAHIRGIEAALNTLGRGFYANTGEFIWATVPFFVLMGYFCLHSRIGEDLYAVPAYLNAGPAHTASLRVQDILRWVFIGGIILGAVLKALGISLL
jgi:TRAP-type C4-dicarboxylate transport system permease small subunit